MAPIAKVARPAARYRPGKVAGAAQSDSEASGSEEDGRRSMAKPIHAFQQPQQAGIVIQSGTAPIDLSHISIGKPAVKAQDSESEYETDSEQDEESSKPAVLKPIFRSTAADVKKEVESSEYETDSESEEEVEKPKPLLKPMFVPKRARQTIPVAPTEEANAGQDELLTPVERKAAAEAEERRKESRAAAAERIRRDMDEKKVQDDVPDLDDTDDVDVEAEFAAWRLRELERIQRDRQALRAKEEEREEIERRRALPQEQRDREDLERAEQSRKEKKKGAQGFMQKYYHKGAFFQDLDILKKHDFTEATQGDMDKSALPSILQVRDYGKKSRSKWTHLSNEDTTRAGDDPRFKKASGSSDASAFTNQAAGAGGGALGAGQGCFACGGPHMKRDCPQAFGSGGGGAPGSRAATGANGAPSASTRQWGAPRPSGEKRQRSQSPPYRRDQRDGKARRYEDRDAPPRAERNWRSRSRSPPRRDPRQREKDERERERDYERRIEKERRREWERERDRDWRK